MPQERAEAHRALDEYIDARIGKIVPDDSAEVKWMLLRGAIAEAIISETEATQPLVE